MRPQIVALTGTGQSDSIKLDWEQGEFKVGLQAVVGGTVTDYNIEATLDDPEAPTTWQSIASGDALAATALLALIVPVRAIRINLVAGTGTVTLTAVQAGNGS
jgi:hypothetical protein